MPAPISTFKVAEVMREVRRAFGDDDGVQVSDQDLIDWINAGQREIVSNNPILKAKATQNTAVGTNSYTMPLDLYRIESVKYEDTLLTSVEFNEAEARYGLFTADRGSPTLWYMFENTIYLYPKPDQVKPLVIFYTRAPMKVSGPNDTIGIPDNYYNALIEFCKSRAYEMDEDWEAEQAKTQKFQFHMDRLKGEENNNRGPAHVIYDPDLEGIYYDGGW